jgi:hypothetical protein
MALSSIGIVRYDSDEGNEGLGKPMLNWNAGKVKNLTGAEIWLFIISRVLIGFGVGVLSVRYYPRIAEPLGLPAIVVGLFLFVFAAKGMFRHPSVS